MCLHAMKRWDEKAYNVARDVKWGCYGHRPRQELYGILPETPSGWDLLQACSCLSCWCTSVSWTFSPAPSSAPQRTPPSSGSLAGVWSSYPGTTWEYRLPLEGQRSESFILMFVFQLKITWGKANVIFCIGLLWISKFIFIDICSLLHECNGTLPY